METKSSPHMKVDIPHFHASNSHYNGYQWRSFVRWEMAITFIQKYGL